MDKDEQWAELFPLFRSVVRQMRGEWYKHAEDHMSNTQFRLLSKLYRHGPLKATDLADMLGVTNSTLTALADKMCDKNLIARERSESDRRVVYLRLTDQGNTVMASFKDYEKTALKKFADRLTSEDIEHLKRIFNKLSQPDSTEN